MDYNAVNTILLGFNIIGHIPGLHMVAEQQAGVTTRDRMGKWGCFVAQSQGLSWATKDNELLSKNLNHPNWVLNFT